jgi:hypothetical protein
VRHEPGHLFGGKPEGDSGSAALQERPPSNHAHDPDGDVDEEDPAPRQLLGEIPPGRRKPANLSVYLQPARRRSVACQVQAPAARVTATLVNLPLRIEELR